MSYTLLDTVNVGKGIFIFASLILLLYRYVNKRARRKEEDVLAARMGCEPVPVLATKLPFGLDLFLKATQHNKSHTLLQFFMETLETTGLTHQMRLFLRTDYNTIEPKNMEAMLSTQFDDFDLGKRSDNLSTLLGNSIFTQDGPAWKHSRGMLRPHVSANREQNYEAIKITVEKLVKSIKDDTVVDLQPLFFDLTLDTTLYLLFGSTMGYSQTREVKEFADAFLLAQDYLSYRGRLGDYYWLANSPKFRRACRTTHQFLDRGIQEALKNPDVSSTDRANAGDKKSETFITALRRKTQNQKAIRDQCVALLLAGRDTTALTTSWTIRCMIRYPQVLDKLRAEVQATIGLGHEAPCPTRATLKRMPYLDTVLKEVIRLYPILPVNGRTAVRTTTLPVGGGPDGQSPFLVRKGEVIGFSVYAMHRRKDLYGEDALEFRPERWEDGSLFRTIGYGYLPFNGGPRVCLGQEYALLVVGYTVVRLIQLFPNMRLPEGELVEAPGKEKQHLGLALAPTDGCRVHMRS